MKKIAVLLVLLFVSSSVYAGGIFEIKIGAGLRNLSGSVGWMPGEAQLPISASTVIGHAEEWEGTFYRQRTLENFEPEKFQKVYPVLRLGLKLVSYKNWSLNIELGTGYVERAYRLSCTNIVEVEVDGEWVMRSERERSTKSFKTKIIPISANVLFKYQPKMQWFQPYIWIGGGLNAAYIIDGIDDSLKKSDKEEYREKAFTRFGIVGGGGIKLCFSQHVGIFAEARLVNRLVFLEAGLTFF